MKTILAVPDQHNFVGANLRRFEALGNLILDRRPDVVVNMGDQNEMGDLYGISGKRTWTFKPETFQSVTEELNVSYEANRLVFEPWHKYNKRRKSSKKREIELRTVFCEGNHDARARQYFDVNQKEFAAKGFKTFDQWARLSEFYQEIYPFQLPVVIEGIAFSHNFVNGTSPASTVDTILKLAAQSAAGAHSHKAEFRATYSSTKRAIFGIQTGWFFDPDDKLPGWVGPQGGTDWWNGVVFLHGVDGSGAFDPEFISTQRLFREYL